MQIVDYNKYIKEHLGRWDKSKIFFNPDNSVVYLDSPDDQDVLIWIKDKSQKLKDNKAKIDANAILEIRKAIEEEKKAGTFGKEKTLENKTQEGLSENDINAKLKDLKESILSEVQRQISVLSEKISAALPKESNIKPEKRVLEEKELKKAEK